MPQTVIVDDLDVDGYILSITTRHTEDTTPAMLEELTYKTVKMWLFIAGNLEKGIHKLPPNVGSVEQRYADEINKVVDTDAPPKEPFQFQETFGDSRVIVWATFRSSAKVRFHLNSDDIPQTAVDTWIANRNARLRLRAEYEPQTADVGAGSVSSTVTAQEAIAHGYAPATPKAANPPAQATEGAIVATRAPNANRPDYANGQLVSFTVTKIVASSNKGSAIYQMWTPLGSQYPTVTVYKLKPDGTLKPDYEAIVPILNTINLSLDKPEAMGTWRLICKAAHVPNKETGADKEFLNVVSLTVI